MRSTQYQIDADQMANTLKDILAQTKVSQASPESDEREIGLFVRWINQQVILSKEDIEKYQQMRKKGIS